jgi:hypothetical protein
MVVHRCRARDDADARKDGREPAGREIAELRPGDGDRVFGEQAALTACWQVAIDRTVCRRMESRIERAAIRVKVALRFLRGLWVRGDDTPFRSHFR